MEDEQLLKMAEKLAEIEDLTAADKKFVEKILDFLREEKKVPKKDRQLLTEMHKEHVGVEEDSDDPNADIDEDDFV